MNGGVVDKNIIRSIIWSYEADPLLGIKPFDHACQNFVFRREEAQSLEPTDTAYAKTKRR